MLTSDGLCAPDALLSKEVSKAVGAVWLLFTRCKLLARESALAVGASKAVSVVRGALVCNATLIDHLQRTIHQTHSFTYTYQTIT